jgi:hypothetical protein
MFSHLCHYLAELSFEYEMFQVNVVEKLQTHILCSLIVSENRSGCEIVKKYGGTRGAEITTWRMRVACWISKTTRAQAHACARAPTPTHTLPRTHARSRTHTHTEICNTYWFSTATVVSLTCLSVTLYIRRLPCFFQNLTHVGLCRRTEEKFGTRQRRGGNHI